MVPTSSESSVSAYRLAVGAGETPDEPEEAFREHLHPVFALVWVASLVRVAGAVYNREVLGAEATLALMTLIALTWYAIAVRSRARRPGD